MTEINAPEWLSILRAMRYEAGTPSLRKLKEMTGLSQELISDVLKGISKPTRGIFTKIVAALTDDQETIDQAMNAFEHAGLAANKSPHTKDADLRYLADAISDLADAIREMRSR
jgi:predicted transcriptional regulator